MSERNWFGLIATITLIFLFVGGMKQCDHDNSIQLKCIEKTGDRFCGQVKVKTNEQK